MNSMKIFTCRAYADSEIFFYQHSDHSFPWFYRSPDKSKREMWSYGQAISAYLELRFPLGGKAYLSYCQDIHVYCNHSLEPPFQKFLDLPPFISSTYSWSFNGWKFYWKCKYVGTERKVRMGRNCPRGLKSGQRPKTEEFTQDREHIFFPYGPTKKSKWLLYYFFFSAGFLSPAFPPMARKKNQDRYQYCKKLVTRIRLGPLWCLKNDELAESWRIISQFGWRQTLHIVELNLRHPEYTCMGWSRWGEIDCLKAQRCNYLQQRSGEGQRNVLLSNGCY